MMNGDISNYVKIPKTKLHLYVLAVPVKFNEQNFQIDLSK